MWSALKGDTTVENFGRSAAWLTMVLLLLLCAAVSKGGKVAAVGRVWWELLLPPRLYQTIYVHFMGPWGPSRAEHGVLVFTETQNDIDAVDAAPHSDAPTLPHFVEVAGWEAAVVHHAHGIQW